MICPILLGVEVGVKCADGARYLAADLNGRDRLERAGRFDGRYDIATRDLGSGECRRSAWTSRL